MGWFLLSGPSTPPATFRKFMKRSSLSVASTTILPLVPLWVVVTSKSVLIGGGGRRGSARAGRPPHRRAPKLGGGAPPPPPAPPFVGARRGKPRGPAGAPPANARGS